MLVLELAPKLALPPLISLKVGDIILQGGVAESCCIANPHVERHGKDGAPVDGAGGRGGVFFGFYLLQRTDVECIGAVGAERAG